ncbi:DUF397 domain-containing protein [Streptomyces sp. NPDC056716]|uniref:DUF397 domain-containing protein n=1 Tax=unclassified Streptomyces TaxID=2593676 RepID=UPI0036C3527A
MGPAHLWFGAVVQRQRRGWPIELALFTRGPHRDLLQGGLGHHARRLQLGPYSGGNNECVEVADNAPALVPVRDSKRPTGRGIVFTPGAWAAFLDLMR